MTSLTDKIWVVVGGAGNGGIIVRAGEDLSSEKLEPRLEYGAVLEQIELAGSRLHYRKINNKDMKFSFTGPEEGWISMTLKGKPLVTQAMPPELSKHPIGDKEPSMTFYAISDVHAELRPNREWLRNLPRFDKSTVLVAGDLAVNLAQIRESLEFFQSKFDNVFYCYGNHETWAHKKMIPEEEGMLYDDSFGKLDAIRSICDDLGVYTIARLIEGVWVVPVLGWYHKSWDTEPPLQPPAGKTLKREPFPGDALATDTGACRWDGLQNGSTLLAQELDKQNERWGIWPLPTELLDNLRRPRGERDCFVLTFSHFLPHLELMPEKRFLFQPNLTQIVGSDFVRKRIDFLNPDLHVFGHSHFPWDMTLEGVRYKSWPLGTPAEQARRIESYPSEAVEKWHPLPVFDSNGCHYPSSPSCWYSLMYTRIKREPASGQMASFVAQSYCPDAPTVPHSIISPGAFIPPANDEEKKRRDRYSAQSQASMQREVR
eukprot:TRINITY_DN30889_c0_g1_i1.p1 TRINITY_DN30889_c0_g1~~TRINITY_DN30889_c0_g1_i1.p1  ORF type:complete len:486 (-),score=57.27 TRINITY_DN30889_c0_g1_i1:155-1612(-)